VHPTRTTQDDQNQLQKNAHTILASFECPWQFKPISVPLSLIPTRPIVKLIYAAVSFLSRPIPTTGTKRQTTELKASHRLSEPRLYYPAEDDSFAGSRQYREGGRSGGADPHPLSKAKRGDASVRHSQRQTAISSPATSSAATVLNLKENPKPTPTSTSGVSQCQGG